jgi:transcriptional regulator with XRE-family HTH domain
MRQPKPVGSRSHFTGAIGTNLRDTRRQKELSLHQVAGDAGISTATLSRIETGRQSLDAALLLVLAGILDVPTSALLGTPETRRDVEAAIATLLRMAPVLRKRVMRTVGQGDLKAVDAADLIEAALEDLAAAGEKLAIAKARLRSGKSSSRK